MNKKIVNNVQLSNNYQYSKSLKNLYENSLLVLYINYTKGEESSLSLKVGFSLDDKEFFFENNGSLKEYIFNETGKFRIALPFSEQFAQLNFKGNGTSITGTLSISYRIIKSNIMENDNAIYTIKEAVIPAGSSISNEINLSGFLYFAIETPTAWTAADITFKALGVSGDYKDVYDDSGAEVVVEADANRIISIDINALKINALNKVMLRSGTSAQPIVQAADRTIYVLASR